MDNQNCSSKGCLAKWIGASVVTYILLNICGYVIHHLWLMPLYQQTANLWRPADQMQQMMGLLQVYYIVLALAIAALFCKAKKGKMAACANATPEECKIGGKHCPIKFGICFGAIIGVLMGAQCASSYIFQPIPLELAQKWFIGDLGQGIVIGVVLSLICYFKNKNCKA